MIEQYRPQLEQALATHNGPIAQMIKARGGVDALKDLNFRAQVKALTNSPGKLLLRSFSRELL